MFTLSFLFLVFFAACIVVVHDLVNVVLFIPGLNGRLVTFESGLADSLVACLSSCGCRHIDWSHAGRSRNLTLI